MGYLKSGLLNQVVSGLVAESIGNRKGKLHLMHANYCNVLIVFQENRTILGKRTISIAYQIPPAQ